MATIPQLADEELIGRYIDTSVDDRGPAYARLADYATPVWAIVGYLNAVRDEARVAREYHVPVEYVRAAQAYYRRYPKHIDALLVLNDALPSDDDQ
jgi:hypothetical protein